MLFWSSLPVRLVNLCLRLSYFPKQWRYEGKSYGSNGLKVILSVWVFVVRKRILTKHINVISMLEEYVYGKLQPSVGAGTHAYTSDTLSCKLVVTIQEKTVNIILLVSSFTVRDWCIHILHSDTLGYLMCHVCLHDSVHKSTCHFNGMEHILLSLINFYHSKDK